MRGCDCRKIPASDARESTDQPDQSEFSLAQVTAAADLVRATTDRAQLLRSPRPRNPGRDSDRPSPPPNRPLAKAEALG